MKAVPIFSAVMALVLFAGAIFPFGVRPAAAQDSQIMMITSPVQTFMDIARGMSLLMPMSLASPLIVAEVKRDSIAGYACTLVSQTPRDYTKMKTRQYFDMQWTVRNSGKRTWHASAVTLKYISGPKMQTYADEFDLPGDVTRGKKVNLVVDMTAPKVPGVYTIVWGLRAGKQPFCRLTLTIGVHK